MYVESYLSCTAICEWIKRGVEIPQSKKMICLRQLNFLNGNRIFIGLNICEILEASALMRTIKSLSFHDNMPKEKESNSSLSSSVMDVILM